MPASRGLWPASEGVDFAAKSVVLLGQALLSGFRAFGTLLLFKSVAASLAVRRSGRLTPLQPGQ